MNLAAPAVYDAWYDTPRGRGILTAETRLLDSLLPLRGGTLLDVGTGSGRFAAHFARRGWHVVGLDPELPMLRFARAAGRLSATVAGRAERLPFADASFDLAVAVTSLCFVAEPQLALAEMWRVSRHGVLLGLLNRRSLLHRAKAGRGAYRGARWDSVDEVKGWADRLAGLGGVALASAVWLPGGGPAARLVERLLPQRLTWGGFLAAWLGKVA